MFDRVHQCTYLGKVFSIQEVYYLFYFFNRQVYSDCLCFGRLCLSRNWSTYISFLMCGHRLFIDIYIYILQYSFITCLKSMELVEIASHIINLCLFSSLTSLSLFTFTDLLKDQLSTPHSFPVLISLISVLIFIFCFVLDLISFSMVKIQIIEFQIIFLLYAFSAVNFPL